MNGTREALIQTHTIPCDLKCEYAIDPIGIDLKSPRLSWRLVAGDRRGVLQKAYRIRVAHSQDDLESNPYWDSGNVTFDRSVHIPYTGFALASQQRYVWQVKVQLNDGSETAWSQTAFWEMGLLSHLEWQASWIEPNLPEKGDKLHPAAYLRRSFRLDQNLQSARLYVTAHGLYIPYLNGQRIADDHFRPGFTNYNHRLQYQTYDVTRLLERGENAIGVILGDGWYRGQHGAFKWANNFGDTTALLAQLHLVFEDGSQQFLTSDKYWRAARGAILVSDLHDGEIYDARLELDGWNTAGFADHKWQLVKVGARSKEALVAQYGPPVRRMREFKPLNITRFNNDWVFDFGQNIAGWVRLQVQGAAGVSVQLEAGEMLEKNGNVYTKNTWGTKQRLNYTLKGVGLEIYEPHFTYFGFRYVKVSNLPKDATPETLTAVVLQSDIETLGEFECSNPMVNQLSQNVAWSTRGNFFDIPTDCPHREKAGVSGDILIFQRTASYHLDTASIIRKWLFDVAAEQREDGLVPIATPTTGSYARGKGIFGNFNYAPAGWAETLVVMPWELYLCAGDQEVLVELYEKAKKWMAFLERRAKEPTKFFAPQPLNVLDNKHIKDSPYIINRGYNFADWASPGKNFYLHSLEMLFYTPPFFPTAYYAWSALIMSRSAQTIGRTDEAAHYRQLYERISEAFCLEYLGKNGRLKPHTQTSYAVALGCEVLPEHVRHQAAEQLANLIQENGDRLSTGFLGTQFLCQALSRYGQTQTAYRLLLQEKAPSWMYQVKHGATTLWEEWQAKKPDGTPQAYSYNHFVYGCIGGWLFETPGGLSPRADGLGYKRFNVAPQPGGDLTHARVSYQSPYGRILIHWSIEAGRFRLELTVPANTEASVRLPQSHSSEIEEHNEPLTNAAGISDVVADAGDTLLGVGSGMYCFVYPLRD